MKLTKQNSKVVMEEAYNYFNGEYDYVNVDEVSEILPYVREENEMYILNPLHGTLEIFLGEIRKFIKDLYIKIVTFAVRNKSNFTKLYDTIEGKIAEFSQNAQILGEAEIKEIHDIIKYPKIEP